MGVSQAIMVGVIQGLTEFLPVSSDGHLVLADILFDLPLEGRDALGFDILLHAGSLLALLVAYRAAWVQLCVSSLRGEKESLHLAGMLVLGTLPGAVAGMLFADTVGDLRSLAFAGGGFLVTGLALILGERVGKRRQDGERVTVVGAFIVGIAQALAILPGVSRSGLTISTGRLLGLTRSKAVDFSFLLAVPIIGGAVGKTMIDVAAGEVVFPSFTASIAGFCTSLAVSLAAIALLRRLAAVRSLAIFAWYLIPLSLLLLYIGR